MRGLCGTLVLVAGLVAAVKAGAGAKTALIVVGVLVFLPVVLAVLIAAGVRRMEREKAGQGPDGGGEPWDTGEQRYFDAGDTGAWRRPC